MAQKKESLEYGPMRFLKKLRQDRGLTCYGMAKKLGLLVNTYVNYEESGRRVDLVKLSDMRKSLELTWDEIGSLIDREVLKIKKERKIDVD